MSAPRRAEKKGSFFSILLAAAVGLFVFVGGLAICAVMFGPVVFVFAVIFGGGVFSFAVLHYLVWGWWLSAWARDEAERENADRSEVGQVGHQVSHE